MSTDLSRPLVSSMGHHDPLDGLVTCVQLQTIKPADAVGPSLTHEAAHFERMAATQDWATTDPLGLGGVLTDAARVVQLTRLGAPLKPDLFSDLLTAALRGLVVYRRRYDLTRPVSQRLAFRELGLAIGLSSIDLIASELRPEPAATQELIQLLVSSVDLGSRITSFWREPEHEVMLATSLLPEGFLRIS